MNLDLYPWLAFLHVAGAFAFVLGHGASAMAALRLRTERAPDRVRALLELSRGSLTVAYVGLTLLVAAGIAAGFGGGWWGRLWIWAALVLLVFITVAMYPLGSQYYAQVRRAVGLKSYQDKNDDPEPQPASPAELDALLTSNRPVALAAIGGGGLLVIIWLMVVKPF
jgi:amino acid transporter